MMADASGTSLDPKGPRESGEGMMRDRLVRLGSAGEQQKKKNTDVKSRRFDGERVRLWLVHLAPLASHKCG